jgi:hypothetical protein
VSDVESGLQEIADSIKVDELVGMEDAFADYLQAYLVLAEKLNERRMEMARLLSGSEAIKELVAFWYSDDLRVEWNLDDENVTYESARVELGMSALADLLGMSDVISEKAGRTIAASASVIIGDE